MEKEGVPRKRIFFFPFSSFLISDEKDDKVERNGSEGRGWRWGRGVERCGKDLKKTFLFTINSMGTLVRLRCTSIDT